MLAYIFRRLVYNLPVYLGILLLVMAALRVKDPVYGFLGKNASPQQYETFQRQAGLDQPLFWQYVHFIGDVMMLDFTTESWDQPGMQVGDMIRRAIVPSLALTIPALVLTSLLSIAVGILSAFWRGQFIDRAMVILAVLGMSVSFLVYIILGQYF